MNISKKNIVQLFAKNQYFTLGLIYLFYFSYFLQIKLVDPDDFFAKSLGDTIPLKNALYMNARISTNFFAALLSKFDLILWKVLTPLVITVLIYSLSTIIILKEKITIESKNKLYFFVFLTMLYVYPLVLTSSIFWVAGSFSYIWPISIGFFSFLHFIRFYNNQKVGALNIVLFLIASFYAAFGQEQISALLSVFSLFFLLYYYFEKRKFVNKYLFIQTIIYICGTLFLLFSPLNFGRLQNDINIWYPEFSNLSSYDKIFRGLIWLCNQLFNKDKFLIIIFLIFLVIYNLKYNSKTKKRLITILLALPLSILILSCIPIDSILHIFTRDIPHFQRGVFKLRFDPIIRKLIIFDDKKYFFSNPIEYIKFFFWVLYLFLIPLTILLFEKKSFKYINSIIFIAGLLSSSIMFFAPSIYASAHRVFLVMDILFVLSIGLLFKESILINKFNIKRFFIIYSIYPALCYITLQWIWWNDYFILY